MRSFPATTSNNLILNDHLFGFVLLNKLKLFEFEIPFLGNFFRFKLLSVNVYQWYFESHSSFFTFLLVYLFLYLFVISLSIKVCMCKVFVVGYSRLIIVFCHCINIGALIKPRLSIDTHCFCCCIYILVYRYSRCPYFFGISILFLLFALLYTHTIYTSSVYKVFHFYYFILLF